MLLYQLISLGQICNPKKTPNQTFRIYKHAWTFQRVPNRSQRVWIHQPLGFDLIGTPWKVLVHIDVDTTPPPCLWRINPTWVTGTGVATISSLPSETSGQFQTFKPVDTCFSVGQIIEIIEIWWQWSAAWFVGRILYLPRCQNQRKMPQSLAIRRNKSWRSNFQNNWDPCWPWTFFLWLVLGNCLQRKICKNTCSNLQFLGLHFQVTGNIRYPCPTMPQQPLLSANEMQCTSPAGPGRSPDASNTNDEDEDEDHDDETPFKNIPTWQDVLQTMEALLWHVLLGWIQACQHKPRLKFLSTDATKHYTAKWQSAESSSAPIPVQNQNPLHHGRSRQYKDPLSWRSN